MGGSALDESSLSLYERGIRQQLRRQQKIEEGAHERAQAELSECTFQPSIRAYGKGRTPADDNALSLSVSRDEEPSWVESLRNSDETDRTPSSSSQPGPQSVASSVLRMLDSWKGNAQQSGIPVSTAGHNYIGQLPVFGVPTDWREAPMQYSPPSRASNQEEMGQEAGSMQHLEEGHTQRHNAMASEVQVLLQDWRGGWCGESTQSSPSALGVTPPLVNTHMGAATPSPERQERLDSAPSPPRQVAALPAVPGPVGGTEAEVHAMLQHWRSVQNAGM